MSDFKKNDPYNNLSFLPPSKDLETKKILRKTILASRALAQLNGAITNLPNPRLFSDTIHLQEAKASSEIENIITTNDELFKSIVADSKFDNPMAKEVVSYKDALWYGLEQIESIPFITTNLCIEIMQKIKLNTSSIRTTPGTTLSNNKGNVIYTPPSGESVIREILTNLENFINEDNSLDPLIKLALLHYQFEAIHPFSDGNGRTGRILLLLYLKIEKLLDIPAIYLSEYIIKNKSEYYKRLRLVTEKEDWESWVLYILDMIEWTSKKGIVRLENILNSMSTTSEKIKKELPKAYSKELIEILFKLPYTKRQHLIDAGLGTAKTVGNYLIELEEKGFLKSVKMGKEKLYLNHQLMAILEKK
jgi:Fic family protein